MHFLRARLTSLVCQRVVENLEQCKVLMLVAFVELTQSDPFNIERILIMYRCSISIS